MGCAMSKENDAESRDGTGTAPSSSLESPKKQQSISMGSSTISRGGSRQEPDSTKMLVKETNCTSVVISTMMGTSVLLGEFLFLTA